MGNGVHYVVFLCCLLVGCDYSDHPKIQPLSEPLLLGDGSAPRVNGKVGSTDQITPAQVSYGRDMTPRLTPNVRSGQAGTIMLDFAETDIRDVVTQILGGVLHVNYTIDPAVTGAVTLHTATPLLPAEVLPTLQMLLGEVGASLGKTGGLYRVLPAGGKAG
ncbi:MAG: type II secretion system protein GspD, partial [Komagataeibacter saccharivorans]